MKKCGTCNITKEALENQANQKTAKYRCNECRSSPKEYRIKNKEKTLEYAAKYRKANTIREYKTL